MFATNGVSTILGIAPEQLVAKSFYFCIAENCLPDAVRCLESAKANDSIAYLRFWFRHPSQDDVGGSRDTHMRDVRSSSDEDEDEGGVHLSNQRHDRNHNRTMPPPSVPRTHPGAQPRDSYGAPLSGDRSWSSSDQSTLSRDNAQHDAVFDAPMAAANSSSSSLTPDVERSLDPEPIEIEAVVSCSSDGLVVILRRARPLLPYAVEQPAPVYANGLFASPWAPNPIVPNLPGSAGNLTGPNLYSNSRPAQVTTAQPTSSLGPTGDGFMNAIRDVAVFAWSLTGINGSLAEYGRGTPMGESQPPGGMPVWEPDSHADPENQHNGFASTTHRRESPSQRMELDRHESSGSDDIVVWRRLNTMPDWHPNYRDR